jgi:hypothetical protein
MMGLVRAFSVRRRARLGLKSGTRLDALPLWCGAENGIGVDEVPEYRDWTEEETTEDQLRIEDVLQDEGVEGRTIFHVGIGNSGLAARFHKTARWIDGITIQENEYRRAIDLSISNYTPLLENKYISDLALRMRRKYDFIVDNNPTTFCCCRRHFSTMLANYTELLKPDGVILTDKVGLHWTSMPNDPRWKLAESEWWTLGKLFGLRDVRYTDSVIGLKKGSAWGSALRTAEIWFRRLPPPAEGER